MKRRSLSRQARALVAHRRLPVNDRALATLLAGIAGAVNAGGFMVVGQYTSHMTGYLSRVADNLVIGDRQVVTTGLAAIATFAFGAMTSSLLVLWARHKSRRNQYALPICVQGLSLFTFAWAARMIGPGGIWLQLLWLCFLMGMQNATVTKLSRARVRTTHVTGMITDIGIELGRALFGRLWPQGPAVADWPKLGLLLRLIMAYLVGGILGAYGFLAVGFAFAMPLALVLLLISAPTLFARN